MGSLTLVSAVWALGLIALAIAIFVMVRHDQREMAAMRRRSDARWAALEKAYWEYQAKYPPKPTDPPPPRFVRFPSNRVIRDGDSQPHLRRQFLFWWR